ncbi:MAG: LysM peptidoglycan-binding domain-containing protein [Melioribacteraceae bacterium]|nr:LysM peptidoglycan-binding domain-containing protein [Melioribacteraceae bacterium]
MNKKNIVLFSIIGFAVIIILILLFVFNPFESKPPAVTDQIPQQPQSSQPDSMNTTVETKSETQKPVKKMVSSQESKDYDIYVVKEGETLQSIAEKLYGDKSKWFDIFLANEANIDWYDTIYVGQELKLPASD